MAIALYNLLLFLLSPLIGLFLLWRLAIGKEDQAHWGERWGLLPETASHDPRRPRFWVHAVSVGEVIAAAPVLRELRKRWPDAFILLSTTTIGGREVAQKQTAADVVTYYPLDFFFVAARALSAAQPDVVVLMEWEIWPNFLTQARRNKSKVIVLNGRISDKGLRRGQKAGFFTQPGLNAVHRFVMQSDEDARRAVLVGAEPAKITALGNTKFDESATPLSPDERVSLRADLGIEGDDPVWVCGSVRPGEAPFIADALRIARKHLPDLQIIVAPRHIERTGEFEEVFHAATFATRRRSSRSRIGEILLLDTFGELARVYAVADVAFVGGSLVPTGGQSVFQPLAQGVPAVFGPYMNNQRDIAALSQNEGIGFTVTNAETLAEEVCRLVLLSPNEKSLMAQKCQALIARNQGVAARCVDEIARLLDSAA